MARNVTIGLLIYALSTCNAFGGRLLDYIRNYDLNDYALGLAISSNQSPYAGAENSTFGYPFLSSFRSPEFTDDWLLIREGDLGVRWISESGWELGLVGRIQTRGLRHSDSPQLAGLEDRKWTLELAPSIGWRGWPVHINFKSYAELLDRHGGQISHLAFALPYERSWGYFIPRLELIHQSDEYANYYYGVSSAEANPTRLAYQPGGALNYLLKIRWGYALTDEWQLTGSVGYEFLSSEISNSPIVDEDTLWSLNVGVAYNSDIFQPQESRRRGRTQARAEFRLGAFNDSVDTRIVHESSAGNPGSEIDLEDLLGIGDEETVLQFDAIIRFGDYSRLEIGYFETSRHGTTTLQAPVNFGDEQFSAGTKVDSRFSSKILRIGYAYSLINDTQKELGFMAGVHFSSFDAVFSAASTGQREKANAETPLPVIGAHGSVAIGRKAELGARIQFFRLHFDRYEGSLNYVSLDLQRRFGDTFSIGIAYNYYALNLDSTANSLSGTLEVRHRGPALFVSAGF